VAEPIISVSGLRGIIGDELNIQVAMRFAAAFATTLPRGPIVVGCDSRGSGKMFSMAIASTLMGHGFDVVDANIIATPTLGVFLRSIQAVGGIQISASHNPIIYNGMKLFSHEGRVIPASRGASVIEAYRNSQTAWVSYERLGKLQIASRPEVPHLEKVLATVDLPAIRQRRFRVLLDSNHGAGALLGHPLLEKLGCEVTILGQQPDGQFQHLPEPLAENLTNVAEHVRSGNFDVGFCQDPDADRLAVIDESGTYIGEEYTSVLCTLGRLDQTTGPVVTNCSSSSMMKRLAKQRNVPFYHSKVGEANVVDKMLEVSAVYGGEGSGGPIDPKVGFVRDSFVGMAQILDLMCRRQQPLSMVVKELPKLAMIKDKVALSGLDLNDLLTRVRESIRADQIDNQDGLRLDWSDRWLLLRGSNTEPIVRIVAEAEDHAAAAELIQRVKNCLA
jgi:phosphomannomutase